MIAPPRRNQLQRNASSAVRGLLSVPQGTSLPSVREHRSHYSPQPHSRERGIGFAYCESGFTQNLLQESSQNETLLCLRRRLYVPGVEQWLL